MRKTSIMRKPVKKAALLILAAALIPAGTLYFSRQRHPIPGPQHTMVVEQKSYTTELYGNGILEPTHTTAVTAPVDGTVLKVLFHYGESVQAGQPLFVLSSRKGLTDYRRALTDYIKAGTAAIASRRQMQQNRLLHDKQLIADNEFRTTANTWYQDRLTLLQARAALESLTRQMHLPDPIPRDLSIRDAEKMRQALHISVDALQIIITAPSTGTVLTPSRPDKQGAAHIPEPGDVIKQGDVLALTGSTRVLRVTIPVNEFSIASLHTGMRATLTGPAFPNITLHGQITDIRPQATAGTDGAPIFPVEITVPLQTEAELSGIFPGMSTEVTVAMQSEPAILIPPEAVQQTAAGSLVLLSDPTTHAVRAVPVKTGKTTDKNVVIRSGLRPGDQIVIADQTRKYS